MLLLTQSQRLTELNLDNNQLSDPGVSYLARAVAQPQCAVSVLRLCGNGIGEEGAAHLAQMIQASRTLRELHLERNLIGNHGAAQLATGLSTNLGLRVFTLEGNLFGTSGASMIVEAVLHRDRNSNALQTRLERLTGVDIPPIVH